MIPGQGASQLIRQLADVLGKRSNNCRRALRPMFDSIVKRVLRSTRSGDVACVAPVRRSPSHAPAWRDPQSRRSLADGDHTQDSQSTVRRRTDAFWRFWISRRRRATPAGRVRCWRWRCKMLTFNMFGAFCASTTSIWPPASPGARAMTLIASRRKRPTWSVSISTRLAKAIVLCVDEKPSIQASERAQGYLTAPEGLGGRASHADRPEPRLQAARHHDLVCSARSRQRQDCCRAFQAAAPCRVPRRS